MVFDLPDAILNGSSLIIKKVNGFVKERLFKDEYFAVPIFEAPSLRKPRNAVRKTNDQSWGYNGRVVERGHFLPSVSITLDCNFRSCY